VDEFLNMNNITATTTLIAALLGSALPQAAHAGRPLQTEDAGVLDRAACEIEGFTARASAFGTALRENSLQLGCGVGASTQLAAAVARAKEDGASARGFELNGKTRLWQGAAAKDDTPAALTLAYALGWSRQSGDKTRHAATELNLAYSHPLDAEWTAHANLGHARDEIAKAGVTTWGLALEHAGFGAWAPMAELFGDDRDAPWWNLGLRVTALPEKFFIDASYGRQITSGKPTLWSVGFKLAF
jgi:hypothetical protein